MNEEEDEHFYSEIFNNFNLNENNNNFNQNNINNENINSEQRNNNQNNSNGRNNPQLSSNNYNNNIFVEIMNNKKSSLIKEFDLNKEKIFDLHFIINIYNEINDLILFYKPNIIINLAKKKIVNFLRK